jgi:hypothetical protein
MLKKIAPKLHIIGAQGAIKSVKSPDCYQHAPGALPFF